jgi:hypothetical protein
MAKINLPPEVMSTPVFYVVDYYLKYDRTGEFIALVKSDKGRRLIQDVEKEMGAKFRGTYFPVMGFGEYTAEDWWELPDFGTLGKFRDSQAWNKALQEFNQFYDNAHPFKARLLGSISDVKATGLRETK